MSLFLVIEDDNSQREECCRWLEYQGHSTIQAHDYLSGVKTLINIKNGLDDPDLIILDHDLGNATGMDIIDRAVRSGIFSEEYFRDRIVLITGHGTTSLGREYTRLGAIGTLIKPVSKPQFWMTIESALEHRRLFVDQRTDWEQAIQILENQGILRPLEEVQGIQDEYNALKETYEQLLEDIQSASGNQTYIAEAYARAYQALEQSLGDDVENIPTLLQNFNYTERFLEDIKYVYSRDRLYFFIFQSYLSRIVTDPRSLRTRNLQGDADGFFEYRIGREYRLYFSYSDPNIKFHRLTRKTKQKETIHSLNLHEN